MLMLVTDNKQRQIQMHSDKDACRNTCNVCLTLAVNAIFCSRGKNSVKGNANVIWPVVPQNARRATEINQQSLHITPNT